ncbi:MAG TPA: glycosyl transferase family 90 [Polyangiaceae bacterium]
MSLARTLRKLARPWDRARLRAELRRTASADEPFPGARDAVRAELAPFSAGATAGARERQWQILRERDPKHAVRLRVRGGDVTLEGEDTENVRARELGAAVRLLVEARGFPDLDVLVDVGDRLDLAVEHAPVLVYCRRREARGQVLVPDFEALRGHESLERAIDRASRENPWERKRPLAFWRGAPTGGRYDQPAWREIPRARLVELSLRRPDLVDARFTSRTHGADRNEELAKRGAFAESVSPEQSLGFRYLIDVDGNASSWSRVVWTLRSNSLLLKQASPYVQWFYPWLEAGRHFVEIASDMSDLEAKLAWAREHDGEARAVADAGSTFAKDRLGRAPTVAYLALVLGECAALVAAPPPVR